MRISFFGKLAEVCDKYLKKGSQVYIEGSLRTRKWTDKDGVEKYTTEIRGDEMKMLGGRQDSGQSAPASDYAPAPRRPAPSNKPKPSFDDLGDDIPFADCSVESDIIGRRMARRLGKACHEHQ